MQRMRLPLCTLACLLTALAPLRAQGLERTFAIRSAGRVVGYQIESERLETRDGRPVLRFDVKGLIKLEVLGAKFDQEVDQTWLLDPVSRAVLDVRSKLTAGPIHIEVLGALDGDGFEVTTSEEPSEPAIFDPATVVISPEFGWLRSRGPTEPGQTAEFDYFMPELGGVQAAKITLAQDAPAEIDSLGAKTPVRVYRLQVDALGLDSKVFVARDSYEVVRYELQMPDLVIERAPEAVIERIQRVDFTRGILVETNLDVEDVAGLTYVRLRAEIETAGDVTAESLNVPGQRFEGTVQDGRIEGVFEIRPRRFDGQGAPPFPFPAALAAEAGKAALEPEENIESDDPAIAAMAVELSAGAASSFEVVERLARWTHDNIAYSIPGGGSAKRTFELRTGECGGHSRVLAAMLRAVGIPARTPIGGMYVPLYGGSFGQHVWTEAYLGEPIGWLPVDCTAGEATFIDAGHIRLSGGIGSFQPVAIEVLDFEPETAPQPTNALRLRSDAYPYTAGETLTYSYSLGGVPIGEEQLTYAGKDGDVHVFAGSLDLGGGGFVETTRTTVGDDGRLVSFRAERQAGDAQATFDVQVADGTAHVESISADGERRDSITVDPAVFMLHNNCTAHFAILASRIGPLAPDEEARIRVLHDEQRSSFSMTLRGLAPQEIELPAGSGNKISARAVEVSLLDLSITLHTDDRGLLLRFHQPRGDVTIELQGR